MLLVTIEKFETNLVLINVNQLKPYNTWNLKFRNKNNRCQCSTIGLQAKDFNMEVEDEDWHIETTDTK
jgi:hypothetical protein